MYIGFISDEIESFEVIYAVNNKSEINRYLNKHAKNVLDLIWYIEIPGEINKPFIDSEKIKAWNNG